MNIKEIEMAIMETEAHLTKLEIQSQKHNAWVKVNEFLLYYLKKELKLKKGEPDGRCNS